jgi:hypothetical protein
MKRELNALEFQNWINHGKLPDWTKRKDVRKERLPKRDKRKNRKRVDTRITRHRPKVEKIFLGIDGEGQTSPITGRHIYTFLAVSSSDGSFQKYVRNYKGLTTDECLEFITSIPPEKYKLFAYSFGYDLTKILQQVDDQPLFRLLRPELRRAIRAKGANMAAPVYWPGGSKPRWSFDYLNGQFKVRKCIKSFYGMHSFTPSVTIFDIWRFFQGKFTKALEDWKTPSNVTSEEREIILKNMREMKDNRAHFDKMEQHKVEAYCLEECRYMAELAEKLTQAHITAEIPLRSYYGAGSSASAMLDKMGIREHIANSRKMMIIPDGLEHAIAVAFAGGRFENSIIGSVTGVLKSYDISSAYPYQLYFLPCLVHGKWELTKNRRVMEYARTAIVNYKLHVPTKKVGWGPFPFRFGKGREKGSICFPESGQTGWIWRDEFLAGERLFPNTEFLQAWVYHCECDCHPFKDLPKYYIERLKIGKEGPGIVLKLGTNSCYGKTAQFIGGEPGLYTSWIWAGLITSGCRAQILDLMALHKDLDNLLMIATDGIATRETLVTPIPRNTGTFDCLDETGKPANKPLGGWEEKDIKKGMFLARPGIYFPLNPTEDEIEKVRARGIGRGSVYKQWQTIITAYESGAKSIDLQNLSRFIGAKTSIGRSGKGPNDFKYRRSPFYGQWITRPVKMGFSPFPKRCFVNPDGTLQLRQVEGESAPYRKGVISKEAEELIKIAEEAAQQPDGGDLSEFHEGGDYDLVSS